MRTPEITKRLEALADKEKSKVLQGFFKTGPGQYGEGDIFLGITVPVLRKFAKELQGVSVNDAKSLLKSAIHEERLLAILLLVQAYSLGSDSLKKNIYTFYLKSTKYINNWDLVDLSAPKIVGNYLQDKSRKPLVMLARSRDLWKKRIAILATFHFIKQSEYSDTLKISDLLIGDEHDLIHKAVGWMLREVGKRDLRTEEQYLRRRYKKMPRTMLRYAIERFPEFKRQQYMNGVA
jgi:3-methyladenine DNA glycosylase AlkD